MSPSPVFCPSLDCDRKGLSDTYTIRQGLTQRTVAAHVRSRTGGMRT